MDDSAWQGVQMPALRGNKDFEMSDDSDGKEFWVHCTSCKHSWVGAHLPMSVDVFVKLGRSWRCPNCGGERINCGKAPDGQPKEAGSA